MNVEFTSSNNKGMYSSGVPIIDMGLPESNVATKVRKACMSSGVFFGKELIWVNTTTILFV